MAVGKTVQNGTASAEQQERPLGKILASYELGHDALMLRYCVEYMRRYTYPWDPRVADGEMLFNWATWTTEAAEVLSAEINDHVPARKIFSIVLDLQRSLGVEALRDAGTAKKNTRDLAGLNSEARRQWGRLASLSDAALSKCPHLYPWYKLGRAVAHFYNAFLYEDRSDPLPSFGKLRHAVLGCPRPLVEKIPVLKRLSEPMKQMTLQDPLAILCAAVGDDFGILESDIPNLAAIHKVSKLNKLIRAGLSSQPDPVAVSFDINPNHPQIVINGESFEVNFEQAIAVKIVLEAGGMALTAKQIAGKNRNLLGVDVAKCLGRLRPEIKALYSSVKGHNGGFKSAL